MKHQDEKTSNIKQNVSSWFIKYLLIFLNIFAGLTTVNIFQRGEYNLLLVK